MTPSRTREAVQTARRFIREAEALLARDKADESQRPRDYPFAGSRESGATRRASLDLTRALAEMRKP